MWHYKGRARPYKANDGEAPVNTPTVFVHAEANASFFYGKTFVTNRQNFHFCYAKYSLPTVVFI